MTITDQATITDIGRSGRGTGSVVYCIGSSILAQGISDTSAAFGYSNVGTLEWAARLLNQRFWHVNRAISGKTTTEMLTWLDSDVLAYSPDIVVVQNGTNEIDTGFSSIVSTSTTLFNRILSSGSKLVILSIDPRDLSLSGWTDNNQATAVALNEWRRQYAESHTGAYYCNTGKYLVDPSNSSGEPISGSLRDGTHPTPNGAFRMGVALSEVLDKLIPERDVLNNNPVIINSSGYSIGVENPNYVLSGVSGSVGAGVSGAIPNSWTVERYSSAAANTATAICSVGATSTTDNTISFSITFTPSNAKGGTITAATKASACQITCSAHGLITNDNCCINSVGGMVELNGVRTTVTIVDDNIVTLTGINSTNYSTFTSGGTIGKSEYFLIRTETANSFTPSNLTGLYEHLCKINVSEWGGWATINYEIDDQGTSNKTFHDLRDAYSYMMPNIAWSGILRSPAYNASGGAFRIRFRVAVDSKASGTGKIKISLPQCRQINTSDYITIDRDKIGWRTV